MTPKTGISAHIARLRNRLEVRRALRVVPATGFVSQPEPRTVGLFARGKQLISGNFLFAGHLVEAPGVRLWDVTMPDAAFAAVAHGFGWMDDLAAVGDAAARGRAQEWTMSWIATYGTGRGPGWTPDLTGRRLIRWVHHALMILSGRQRDESLAFYHSLSAQTQYLSRVWQAAAPGLPRFEALTGLIYAGLVLTGMEAHVAPAVTALAQEATREIDAAGGIPTRNPEELLEVFTLLTWAMQAISEAGRTVPPQVIAAVERIAPTLRALRHADGGLARFHGGGRGLEGRLDTALASSGVKAIGGQGLAMGFARLAAGRTTVIVDAANPPDGMAGGAAHASTLAFEMTSGRRPVIVSCGSGAPFGRDWHRAGRATLSHSTLAVEGYSSSRFGTGVDERLEDRAEVTLARQLETDQGHALIMAHVGWVRTHGLTHQRDLTLSSDGRKLVGLEGLMAQTTEARARFAQVVARTKTNGLRFGIRFHLHPDVDAALDLGGTAVSLALKSGEIWVFRHDGNCTLSLEASVYLEKGRLKPRATKQVVLGGYLSEIETRIGWTLAKAQDTPLAIRDLEREEVSPFRT